MNVLTVRKELLLAQVKNAHWMLEQIENELGKGVPGEDFDADPADVDAFMRRLVGELSLVSQMCDSLASTLAS